MQMLQLVDSEIESTRKHWRKEVWEFPDEIVNDPRPMKEILGHWPHWLDAESLLRKYDACWHKENMHNIAREYLQRLKG